MKFAAPICIIGFFALMLSTSVIAQVAVNNSSPKSVLDITASNSSAPAITDGILVPRIDAFPSTDPGADQDGMLVFLTTAQGNFKRRHHYWDATQSRWLPFGGEWMDGHNDDDEPLTYVKQAFNENQKDVVITDDGRIGMGTDDPDESIEIKLPGDNDIQITSTNVPNAPNFHFVTYNGTFASRTFLNDDDIIGQLAATTWSGSGESDVIAAISSLADGDHYSGNLPTKYNLSVTAPGETAEDQSGIEMTIEASGNVGIGNEDPSASLHIKGGGSIAGSAPIKLNAGSVLSTPEKGTFEYDGTHLYFTPQNERNVLLKGLTNTGSLTFGGISPHTSGESNMTVTNASVGSSCNCSPGGTAPSGINWSCYVSSVNTVTVRLTNMTNNPISGFTMNWKVTVIE